MLLYVHTWSTHLHSILLRNHTWELHWYAADDADANVNNDNGWGHTLNLYIYLMETGIVLWSPKVLSKSNSYFMRSCNNFFCWLALRCLQLSLTIDWRSALLFFVSRIQVACLVLSCVLFGSMAKLLFSLSVQSVLAPGRWLMFLIGKMISSIVILLALKSSTIPKSVMVLVPGIHTAAYYPSGNQPHQVLKSTFCYQSIWRSSAHSELYA